MRMEAGTIEAKSIKAVYVNGERCREFITALEITETKQTGDIGFVEYTPKGPDGRYLTDGDSFVTRRLDGVIRIEK